MKHARAQAYGARAWKHARGVKTWVGPWKHARPCFHAQDRGDTLGRVSADRGPCTHGGACAHGRICELMESPPHQSGPLHQIGPRQMGPSKQVRCSDPYRGIGPYLSPPGRVYRIRVGAGAARMAAREYNDPPTRVRTRHFLLFPFSLIFLARPFGSFFFGASAASSTTTPPSCTLSPALSASSAESPANCSL